MFIAKAIQRIEKRFTLFNREPFTSTKLTEIAYQNNIVCFPDKLTSSACAYIHRGQKFIAYNPYKHESDTILNIGHELGHYALGHIRPNKPPLGADIFSKSEMEKDAGIVGFLLWLPTTELCRMENNGRLDIDEVYKFAKCFDGDLSEDECLKLCHSRIRIYNGFKRVTRTLRPPTKQLQFNFPHQQLKLFK